MDLQARMQRLTDWLLGTEPAMRIRMAMASFAVLMMALCIVVVLMLVHAGFGRKDWAWWWALCTAGGLISVLVLIRSGWSLRLQDPSMTQWQIRYALLCNAAAYVLLGQARGVTPVILSLVLMFGIFGMTARQLAANMAYALLVFAAALATVAMLDEPGRSPALEAAHGAMIVLVLMGSTFIAIRLQHIRRRLTQQKHQLSQALERISHLATHDELTGLVNRRHMAELIRMELQRCERAGRPLVLAILDLDHFKSINDSEGHAVGDQVLQAFARTVQATVRNTDVLARWGGEEFVLMLYDSDAASTLGLLERVRAKVQAMELSFDGRSVRVTVSMGVALSRPGEPLERLLERADVALYEAKSQGRNRVVLQDEATPGV